MSQDNSIDQSIADLMEVFKVNTIIKERANSLTNNVNFKIYTRYNGIRIGKCKLSGSFTSIVRCDNLKSLHEFMNDPIIDEEVVFYYTTKKHVIYLFRRYTKEWNEAIDQIGRDYTNKLELYDQEVFKQHSQESDDEMDAIVKEMYDHHAKNLM